jgi:hypothetical protein
MKTINCNSFFQYHIEELIFFISDVSLSYSGIDGS